MGALEPTAITLPKNKFTEDLQLVLNEQLKGKQFVYKSKYGGETFGNIGSVIVTLVFTWDNATTQNFHNSLDSKKYHNRDKVQPEPIPVTNPYVAYRPIIRIKSTSNITYEMDEIFILNL